MKEVVISASGCLIEYREFHQPGHGSTLYRTRKIVQPSCIEDGIFVPASDVVLTRDGITKLRDLLNHVCENGGDEA